MDYYDHVELKTDLPEIQLEKGSHGIIANIINKPSLMYEIRFIDSLGQPILSHLVKPDNIKFICKSLEGIDFIWFAVDRKGSIGCFTTGGCGAVPIRNAPSKPAFTPDNLFTRKNAGTTINAPYMADMYDAVVKRLIPRFLVIVSYRNAVRYSINGDTITSPGLPT